VIQNKIAQVQATPGAFEIIKVEVLLLNLGIGLVLSLAMSWHFQAFGSTFSNRREFSRNFPLIMLTTILVISVVKSSIALSLGLVGALSIVRFRTPIKEPEELAYLFLTIGLGLGLGAEMPELTIYAGIAILGAMALVSWNTRDRQSKSLFLSIEWPDAGPDDPLGRLNQIIGTHASSNDLRRVDRAGGQLDATYYLDLGAISSLSDLLAALDQGCPGATITVVDQNRMPSV
jgi:hypothetical protein